MPSNQSPLGALPSRFKRERLLIIGCGDVGQRVVRVQRHVRVVALTSSPARVAALRAQGVTPIVGNLDVPASLQRLAGWATRVLHLAPPPLQGSTDPRTLTLTRLLMRRSAPRSVVYGSTSGVYGDCAGAWVAESRKVNPITPRAQRRVNAEARVRHLGRLRSSAVRVSVLRIPGIYAPDREGGTPRERLIRGTPVLAREGDVLLFRMGLGAPAKHVAILSGEDRIVHAYWVRSVCETRLVPWWQPLLWWSVLAGFWPLCAP